MAEPDPIEELVQVVRRADARLPDTARARGAAALVERLAREAQQPPAPLRRRRVSPLLWTTLGAAVAAAVLLALGLRRPATVVTTPPPARVLPEKPADLPAPAAPSAAPDERAILHTLSARGQQHLEAKPGEVVRAALADQGRLVLREAGRVIVEDSTASGIVLGLEAGTLLVSYDHPSGRGLAVRTRDALVRVTGTVFAVEAGHGPTRVTVVRGAVQVETAGLPVAVAAGKRWQIGAKSLSVPEASIALALRELGGIEESRPAASSVSLPVTAEPKRAATPAEAPPESTPPRPDGEADAEARYRQAERALAGGRAEAAKAELLGLVAQHPSSNLAGPATYELGRIDFAARDFASARARFASLRASDRADAARFREPAAYLVCRSEQELGHRDAAMSCLELYRRDFPHAPHAGDALAALALLRLDAHACASALPLVEDYLTHYPNGEHTAALKTARKRCHD